MKCCGVVTANDWRNATKANWDPTTALRPEGCCKYKKDSQERTISSYVMYRYLGGKINSVLLKIIEYWIFFRATRWKSPKVKSW